MRGPKDVFATAPRLNSRRNLRNRAHGSALLCKDRSRRRGWAFGLHDSERHAGTSPAKRAVGAEHNERPVNRRAVGLSILVPASMAAAQAAGDRTDSERDATGFAASARVPQSPAHPNPAAPGSARSARNQVTLTAVTPRPAQTARSQRPEIARRLEWCRRMMGTAYPSQLPWSRLPRGARDPRQRWCPQRPVSKSMP
jgi:hypothetical protein